MSAEGWSLGNITRCVAELSVMYLHEVYTRIGEIVIDALDCFGDDTGEDAAIHSDIWGTE